MDGYRTMVMKDQQVPCQTWIWEGTLERAHWEMVPLFASSGINLDI